MLLVDFLTEDRVVVPIEAVSLREAADSLINALVVSGVAVAPEELEGFLGDSLHREVVSVGRQAFLLHFRTDAVEDTAVALGVSREPIALKEDSSKDARIVILVVAPHRESTTYLQVVATIARALGDPEVVEGLLGAESAAAVLELPELGRMELPGYLMVRDFMVPRAVAVTLDTTLLQAARVMVREDVPALPVVSDDDEVLGMIGHRELIGVLAPRYVKRMDSGEFVVPARRLQESGDPRKILVRDVMERNVLCVSDEQNLADVASMMINKELPQVPVVREGVLVGMLWRSQLVRKMMGL